MANTYTQNPRHILQEHAQANILTKGSGMVAGGEEGLGNVRVGLKGNEREARGGRRRRKRRKKVEKEREQEGR